MKEIMNKLKILRNMCCYICLAEEQIKSEKLDLNKKIEEIREILDEIEQEYNR